MNEEVKKMNDKLRRVSEVLKADTGHHKMLPDSQMS
jgi:hypothetical protein